MNPIRMRQRGVFIYGMRPACLYGYRLLFNKIATGDDGFGFANIEEDPFGRVEGILYEIDDYDLMKLDIFEGHPQHYNRHILEVQTHGGWNENAFVYIADNNQIAEGLKTNQDYLAHLLSAKRYLSKKYYKELLKLKE
jgi:gamma-glutamylcyclotransferase (GGCT)/AIG2-like uncharacterized protein YtfP